MPSWWSVRRRRADHVSNAPELGRFLAQGCLTPINGNRPHRPRTRSDAARNIGFHPYSPDPVRAICRDPDLPRRLSATRQSRASDSFPVIMPSTAERAQDPRRVTAMVHREDGTSQGPPQKPAAGSTDLERVWIARARSGDMGAFEAIFRAHYQRLCLFAEGFVNSSDQAEDLVEEVFVRTWESRESCRGCDSLKAYLYVAVRNRAFKLLRHRRVVDRLAERTGSGGPVPGMSANRDDPAENAAASELARAVERAIASLPERSRQAYLLHRQHGMSYAEIAATMEISTKTVENHLARAVKALRENLAPWTT